MINKIKEAKSVIDFQITLNKKCNLRCSHCYLSDYNDYEMKFSTLKKTFDYIDALLNQNKFIIKEFDITILGGEISLITNNKKFIYIFKKTEKLIAKYKNINIKILFFSNFIKIFNNKLLYLLNDFSLKNPKNIFIVSSFEKDTKRFKNEETLKKWAENIKIVKNLNKNIKLVNSLTMTKETVEFIKTDEYKDILDLFNFVEYELFIENDKTNNLKPKYNDLIELFKFQYEKKKKYKGSNYNKDGIGFDKEYINKFNISPKGKIDFDNVLYENNEININEVDVEEALNFFYKNNNKKNIENLKFINKNCFNCKFVDDCLGGFYIYRENKDNNFSFDKNHVCPGFYQLREHLEFSHI